MTRATIGSCRRPKRQTGSVSIAEGAIAASSHLDEPIRAERLAQHAQSLAAADRITEKPTKGRNLRRVMAGTVVAGRRGCSTAPTKTVVPVLPRGRGAPRRGMRLDKWAEIPGESGYRDGQGGPPLTVGHREPAFT